MAGGGQTQLDGGETRPYVSGVLLLQAESSFIRVLKCLSSTRFYGASELAD
jgi:hypothetical protein